MKQYGQNQSTEISKKQISCLYGAAKRGELKIERWMMSDLYDLADFYGIDYNGNIAKQERTVKSILDAYFSKNIEECQSLLNSYTNDLFSRLSHKTQDSCNRELVA